MSETPDDLRYASSHEWVRVESGVAVIGITDHAQDSLNDIVYVELPEPGTTLDQGEEFGVVESVKSVSDVYAPVAGEVVEANKELEDAPETINTDPYGAGWLIKIRMTDPSQVDALLDAAGYRGSID